MAKPWEKYGTPPMLKPWEKYGGDPVAQSEPQVPAWESALRGAAQGASLGFADEAAGGLDYAKEAIKRLMNNGTLLGSDDLSSAYTRGRDESRANYDAAQKANPGTYLTGQLAGSLALPTGALGVGKTAALGAVQALGNSNADSASGLAKDTALGAGLGAVSGAVAPLVSKGVDKLGGLASNAVEGTGDAIKQSANLLANKATDSEFGREALDEGVLGLGDKAKNIAGKVGSKIDDLIGGDITPEVEKRIGSLESIQKGVQGKAAEEAKKGLLSDLDIGAIGAGGFAGGVPGAAGAAAGVIGKNLANSRGAATGAVTLDNIGEVLKRTPQALGKFAKPLAAAQERGALSPTLFILQQTNPEFRKMVSGNQNQ